MTVEPEYREALAAITQRIVDAQDDYRAMLQAVDEGIVAVLDRVQKHGQPDDNDLYMLTMFMAPAVRVLIARELSLARSVWG